MRLTSSHVAAALAVLATSACSIPDKQPASGDGGLTDDASTQPDGPDDDESPDTTINSAPAEFSREGVAMFEFSSDETGVTFECSIDGETPVPCQSPYSRSLGDGSHSFAVRATDSAGNSDDTPAEHLWSIDRVVPTTTLTRVPPVSDNSVMVKFEFTSNEMNVVFECSLDNATYRTCTSGENLGPIDDGQHTFAVRAMDRAGNVDTSPAIHGWTVDTSTPDTQLLSGPSGDVTTTSATFTFVSPDAGSGATFQCSLDASPFQTCTSPKTYPTVGEGSHTFAVRVRDAVGNLDPTPATQTWRVDLQAPNTTIVTGPMGVEASASASFTFSSNEQGVSFECSLDNAAFTACATPFNATGLGQGAHTFAVRAKDMANQVDPTPATRMWTVDTVAPDIDISAGPAPGSTVGPRVTFAFTVSEGTPQCSLDNAAFAACTSPVSFSLPAGPHDFRIRASDAAGNVTTVTRAFTVACAAPGPTGAAGLLHLDDAAQTQANAVAGGAAALLGDTDVVEDFDPAFLAAARFGGGFNFVAAESDRITWPAALGTTSALSVELWARPDSLAGARDVLVSGDGRVAIRVVAVTATTVRFTATLLEDAANTARVATSAVVAADQWHHVLVSLQGATLSLNVDGARTEVAMVMLETPLALDSIRLGGEGAAAYQGALDEVWVALTPTSEDEAAGRYCPL